MEGQRAILLRIPTTLLLRRNSLFEPLVRLGGRRVAPLLRISFNTPFIEKSPECRVHLRAEMQQIILTVKRDVVLAPAHPHNNAITSTSKLPMHFTRFFLPQAFGAFC